MKKVLKVIGIIAVCYLSLCILISAIGFAISRFSKPSKSNASNKVATETVATVKEDTEAENKKKEETKAAEAKKEEAKKAEEAKKVEADKKKKEEAKVAADKKAADAKKAEADKKKKEETKKAKAVEDKKKKNEAKAAEEKKIADAKKASADKKKKEEAKAAENKKVDPVKFFAKLPQSIKVPSPNATMPKDVSVENGHIWLDKALALSEPNNYIGKRAIFRGIIQKSVGGKVQMSIVDSGETAVTAIYSYDIYDMLPRTPLYEYIVTVWGVVIDVDETNGVILALDTIYATEDNYISDFSQYHTYEEARAGNGTFDMIKLEGVIVESVTNYQFYINTPDGEFCCTNPNGFAAVYDFSLMMDRNIRVYGALDRSDGSFSVDYIEPII